MAMKSAFSTVCRRSQWLSWLLSIEKSHQEIGQSVMIKKCMHLVKHEQMGVDVGANRMNANYVHSARWNPLWDHKKAEAS
jgi:hypothetical protein